jgi:hypothetical protein
MLAIGSLGPRQPVTLTEFLEDGFLGMTIADAVGS